MSNTEQYVDVALSLPKGPFTYKINLSETPELGMRAEVPFINGTKVGVVTHISDSSSFDKIKSIKSILDSSPILSSSLLKLTEWIAEYYSCSYGEAIANALPALVKRGRKVDFSPSENVSVYKEPTFDLTLTPEQQAVFDSINGKVQERRKASFLLQGVTGSGKSEIYLRLINETLKSDRSVICMVPEIALTFRLVSYFKDCFGDTIEILHSKLTDKERFDAWNRIRKGEKRLILGPRSTIFSPVTDLGLIIMDEEHENSYKQEDVPRYHVREVANKLAEIEEAVFVMGTATPSLEARHRASTGEYAYLRLDKRAKEQKMPEVHVADLKNELTSGGNTLLSRPLMIAIEQTLKKKESVLLFLNRRGYATHLQCMDCGEIVTCKSCQISLTYHAKAAHAICHYCGYVSRQKDTCPSCKGSDIKYGGGGTEKIEAQISKLFPEARVDRLDTDRVRKKGEAQKIIEAFASKKIDILIGTQMLAKGFDFPHVTLVGVINADGMLSIPDFRAFERSFQLITQVAGRAGRGEKEGKVIIQTFMPDNYAINMARHHDYDSFYEKEVGIRQELSYPPFSHLMNVMIRSKNEDKVKKEVEKLREELAKVESDHEHISILGPAPLPFYKLRGYFRWHVMLKGNDLESMHKLVELIRSKFTRSRGTYLAIDVDPVSIL